MKKVAVLTAISLMMLFPGISTACSHELSLTPNPPAGSNNPIYVNVGEQIPTITCVSLCNIPTCNSYRNDLQKWTYTWTYDGTDTSNVITTKGATSTFSCQFDSVDTYDVTLTVKCSGIGGDGIQNTASLTWTIIISDPPATVQLTTHSTPGGSVTLPSESPYTCAYDTDVQLQVTPEDGYHFIGWQGDTDNITGEYPNAMWIDMRGNYSITAVFESNLRKGPYLIYKGNNTSMAILWQFNEPTNCQLEWDDDYTFATPINSVDQSVTGYGSDYQHQYQITGLSSGTLYYYRLLLPSNQTFSGSFRTAPESSAARVKFMVTGDCQDNDPAQETLWAQIKSIYIGDPEYQTFLLQTGDKVATDAEENWTGFFNRSDTNTQELLAHLAFQSCLGNHETYAGGPVNSGKYWPYPYVNGEHYWSFDYGPAHIVVVDQYVNEENSPIGPTQLTWIANDLSNTNKEWKFIMLHEPGYSAYPGPDDDHEDNEEVQSLIHTLQSDPYYINVDMVFAGHQHYYAHSEFNGVKHITNAGGAGSLRTPGSPDYLLYAERTHSFNKIEIDGCTLAYTAIRSDGTVIESFTLDKCPPAQLTLSLAFDGEGTISVDGSGYAVPTDLVRTEGETETLTATAAEGYIFDHWEDENEVMIAESETIDILMDADKTSRACFVPSYSVTIYSMGDYTIDPVEGPYGSGATITVQAASVVGYQFSGWTDEANNSLCPDMTYSFQIESDTIIVAHYQPLQFTFDVIAQGSGAITCEPASADGNYRYGAVVYVTAKSDAGYRFKQWAGDISGTENPKTIFMDNVKTITAEFERVGYVLNMSTSEGGMISPSSGDHVYPEGTEITVRAFGADGYAFSHWTDVDGILGVNTSSSTAIFTMDNQDHALTANFAAVETEYSLNISSDISGVTNPISGIHRYPAGSIPVTAAPQESFIRWEGTAVNAGKVSDPSQNIISVELDNNYTLHAVFEYKLNISRNCDGGTVRPGLGVYRKVRTAYPGTIDIQAVPNDGYKFTEWTGLAVANGQVTNPSAASSAVTMNADCDVKANFETETYDFTAIAGTNGVLVSHETGISYQYDYGSVVPIEAQPDPGYHFAGWEGTAVNAGKVTNPSSPNTAVIMGGKELAIAGEYQLTATFEIDEYVIDLSSTEGGYADMNNDGLPDEGIHKFTENVTFTVKAVPDAGYRFVEWKGTAAAEAKVEIEDPANYPLVAAVTVDGNYTLKAVFEPLEPTIVYVRLNGDNDNDGLSWDTAFATLQKALDWAEAYAIDQIWVAAGTYYPSEEQIPGDARSASFVLVEGVTIYGGFAASESSIDQRDTDTNMTILSGDIDHDGLLDEDNSYHVVIGADNAILNGFTIKQGYSDVNGNQYPNNCGAGIQCHNVSPVIQKCIITENIALYGGGMHSYESSAQVIDCHFRYNAAIETGGSIYNESSNALLFKNCEFVGNIDQGIFSTPTNNPSVTLNQVDPGWYWDDTYGQGEGVDFTTGNPHDNPTNYGSDQEYQIRWGNPLCTDQSGLGFTGINLSSPLSFEVGKPFEIGQLRHFNYVQNGGTSASKVKLTIELGFSAPAGMNTSFDLFLDINETSNTGGTICDPDCCADIIKFPASFPVQTINVDGREYTLEILGFGDSPSTLEPQFSSDEGQANAIILWCQITPPPARGAVKNVKGNVDFYNCLFVGNTSDLAWGGALANWSCDNISISGCTITGNHGDFCGGIYSFESNIEISNSILWGNVDDDAGSNLEQEQLYNVNADVTTMPDCTVTYSCVQDDEPGETPRLSHDNVASQAQAIIGFVLQSMVSSTGDKVEIVGAWTNDTSDLNHPVEAGSDRALIFVAHAEDNDSDMNILSVTYGGQVMTPIIERNENGGGSSRSFVGAYILNEAGIAAATSNSFVVTWSQTPYGNGYVYSSVFFENVNQDALVGDIAVNGNTSSPIETDTFFTNTGDMVIAAGTVGNKGSYSVENGFTEALEITIIANSNSVADSVVGYRRAILGTSNIYDNPIFVLDPDDGGDGWGNENDDFGDQRLSTASPCIDAGNNDAVLESLVKDLDGKPRFVDDPLTETDTGYGIPPIVDMGAYEYQAGNTPPVAVDDYVELLVGDSMFISITDLLANDEDVDFDTIEFRQVVTAPNGTLEPDNGGYIFSPVFTGAGTDAFTYTIYDGKTMSSEARVTIQVGERCDLIVDAGIPQTVTFGSEGTIEVTLSNASILGDGVVNPGAVNINKIWTNSYAPPSGSVVWDDDTALHPIATLIIDDPAVFAYMERVQFELTLTGTEQVGSREGEDTVIITVLPSSGFQAPPQVDAGVYDPIAWPEGTEQVQKALDGTVTDDGLPNGVLYYHWTVVEAIGGEATLDDPFAEDTTVTFTDEGRYTLRLTATDLSASGSDETVIVVGTPPVQFNNAPTVRIIDAQKNDIENIDDITLYDEPFSYTFYLDADDPDNLPQPLAFTWSLLPDVQTPVNGVQFSEVDTSGDLTATFTKEGTYQIQVEANDGEYSAYDTVIVKIIEDNPNNLKFEVNAGPDKEIQLPAMAYLIGKASLIDSLGNSISLEENELEIRWSLLDGPARVSFADVSDQPLCKKAEFTESGTYTFRLEGDFNSILSNVDDIVITVKPSIAQIAAGTYHSLLINNSEDNTVYSTGGNVLGILGVNILETRPEEYADFSEDTLLYHAINRQLLTWDRDRWSSGYENFNHRSILQPVYPGQQNNFDGYDCFHGMVSIDASWLDSLSLDQNGNVWSWGAVTFAYWNSEYTTFTASKASLAAYCPIKIFTGNQYDPSGFLNDIISFSTEYFKYYAIDYKEDAWAWGEDLYSTGNALGTGYYDRPEVPTQVITDSGEALHNIKQISAALSHALFLKQINCTGEVYAAGKGSNGRLGVYPEPTGLHFPTIVSAPDVDYDGFPDINIYGSEHLRNIISVDCGGANSMALEAIDPDNELVGHVYTWGSAGDVIGNEFAYTTDQVVPVLVQKGEQGSSGFLDNIVAIAMGDLDWDIIHCIALEKRDGGDHLGCVYTWGDNSWGQLGNNSTVNSPTPVKVKAPDLNRNGIEDDYLAYGSEYLYDIIAVEAGSHNCFAVDIHGDVYVWGRNDSYQLGLGHNIDISLPQRVIFEKSVHNVTSGAWYYRIQEAIDDENTMAGDHIIVHPGVYYESVSFSGKGLRLMSEDSANPEIVRKTVIKGSLSNNQAITIDSVENAQISGFTIASAGGSGGISVENSSNIILSNNLIHDTRGTGINISNSSSNIGIFNNYIYGNSNGIVVTNFNNVCIHNNTVIENTSVGIFCSQGIYPILINNIVYNNGTTPNLNSLSSNISGISDYSFCCIGGLSEPYSNGNFSADPLFVLPGYTDDNGTPDIADDDRWISGDYHLLPGSPCINRGFAESISPVDFTSETTFNTTYPALYQVGDLIEIGQDRTPREVVGIDSGEIQFSPSIAIPTSETMIINRGQKQFDDTTCDAGTTNTFVVQDVGLYSIGDKVKIGGDYVNITYVYEDGRIKFSSSIAATTGGMPLSVWKLLDTDGNPRVVNGRVDIGADEFCAWKVDAGKDKTITAREFYETTDASVEYTGPADGQDDVQIQWSVVDPDSADVDFGEIGRYSADTLWTSVDFNENVGSYALQLTLLEDGWPIAWDTVQVDVLYDISCSADSILDVARPGEAYVDLDIYPTTGPAYDVQWQGPISEWYGRSVSFRDDDGSLETINVELESAGCFPLTVELTDQTTGEILGRQAIAVTADSQFVDVSIESSTDVIELPVNRVSVTGHVKGILGDYTTEWLVKHRDKDEEYKLVNQGDWSTDITFEEPGSYEIYLVVKQIEKEQDLNFPKFTIIGAAQEAIEVKPRPVDAGPDQTIIWPQNFVYLFGQAPDADTYSWTCNDVGVSFDDAEVLNPKVTSLGIGWYTFTLSASNGGEPLGIDDVNIFVNDPSLNVEAGDDKTGYIGEYITLSDLNTIIPLGCTYSWMILSENGEIIDSNLATAAIRFTKAGKYQVYLTVETVEPYQFSSDSLYVTVSDKGGISGITSNPSNPVQFHAKENVVLTASLDLEIYPIGLPANVTAQWILDDDVEILYNPSNPLSITASFDGPGYYPICLELYENNNCIDYATTAVYVTPPSISVDAKVEGKDEYVAVCNGTDILLNINGSQIGVMDDLLYEWKESVKGSGSVTGLPEPSAQLSQFQATFTGTGTYELTLTASYQGITISRDTVTVILLSPGGHPIVNAGGNYSVAVVNVPFLLSKSRMWDDEPILQEAAHLQWMSTPSASFSADYEINPYVTFTSEGRHELELTYTDAGGKSDSDTVTIYVQPNYQVIAGSTKFVYPYMDLELDEAKVLPLSSQYVYEWTCSPSNAEISFAPDRFRLNPTVQFEQIGDYVLTLNVSKGVQYIGSNSVTVQVRPNPNVDDQKPEISTFTATYDKDGNQTDIENESDVHGNIQISVEACDKNIDRIELSLYETANPSNMQVIQGGTYTVEAGTPANPTQLLLEHQLDAYLSGEVTLKARAIDRFGNIDEKTKTFISSHSIKCFSLNKDFFDSFSEAIEFDGELNTAQSWIINVESTQIANGDSLSIAMPTFGDPPIVLSSDCGIVTDGRYTATLSTATDTATVEFDVITGEINPGAVVAELIATNNNEYAIPTNEFGIPTGSILSIEDGIYDLKGVAYYETTDSFQNQYMKYKIILSDNSGFTKILTPGIQDARGFRQGYVVPNTSLHYGSFPEVDFTDVPDGVYTLTLTAECLGVTVSDSIEVAVSVPLKVGHVKFSQEDMSVNIGGYPIRVVRTYDGFNRHRKGDFGYGWTSLLSKIICDCRLSP